MKKTRRSMLLEVRAAKVSVLHTAVRSSFHEFFRESEIVTVQDAPEKRQQDTRLAVVALPRSFRVGSPTSDPPTFSREQDDVPATSDCFRDRKCNEGTGFFS
jgi:hypothetical protein